MNVEKIETYKTIYMRQHMELTYHICAKYSNLFMLYHTYTKTA